MRILSASLVAFAALAASGAQAHVTLETQQAVAGSTYKAVMRVPHGCGSSATTAVRVRIPDGVVSVKPQPKPGWQLTTVTGKLAEPLDDGHGGKITEGVREIAWTGGRLLDAHYDEFVFRAGLPKAGEQLWFPVVQECEQGVERWIEIPESGKKADDYKKPAPGLKLLPRP
jgi:uncharacterized protein YcnI